MFSLNGCYSTIWAATLQVQGKQHKPKSQPVKVNGKRLERKIFPLKPKRATDLCNVQSRTRHRLTAKWALDNVGFLC